MPEKWPRTVRRESLLRGILPARAAADAGATLDPFARRTIGGDNG